MFGTVHNSPIVSELGLATLHLKISNCSPLHLVYAQMLPLTYTEKSSSGMMQLWPVVRDDAVMVSTQYNDNLSYNSLRFPLV
jgi:hypothetical protein